MAGGGQPAPFARLVSALLLLLACASSAPPPEHSAAMGRLAEQSRQLGELVFHREPDEATRRQTLRLLAAMQETTRELAVGAGGAGHPLLDAHLEPFRRDLGNARRGLEREPPDYIPVAVVYGACVYCHERRPE